MDNPYELPEQEPQLAEFMPTEEPIAAPERNDGDPLLEAVLWLCRHHGVDRSEQSLMEGQAVQGILTPDQALPSKPATSRLWVLRPCAA